MAGICGRARADGLPCRRPAGCSLPHAHINAAAAAGKSLTKPAPITDQEFRKYPSSVNDLVLAPLARQPDAGIDVSVHEPPALQGDYLTAGRLIAEVVEGDMVDGFTISPHGVTDGSPPDGAHAVTIQGTDLPLPHDAQLLKGGTPSPATLSIIARWLGHMAPALESGHAWVGGFLHPADDEDERAGQFEINVTILFKPEHRDEAFSCSTYWDQKSMWTFDKNHDDGGGYTTDTGGKGSGSVFTNPDAPDYLDQPRKLLKDMLESPRRRWWQFRRRQ